MEEIKKEMVPSNKSTVIQIIFLILLMFSIAGLIIATMSIFKYNKMLTNPLGYNLEKWKINQCECWNDNGEKVRIVSTKYIPDSSELNYSIIP